VLLPLLLFQVADAGRRGYARLLEAFCDEATDLGLDPSCRGRVSAAAFCQARAKLDPQSVRRLLHAVGERFDADHGARFRFKGRRLLAVDGTKFLLQRSAALWDQFGGTPNAHHPLTMVATLFDVLSKVPLDVDVARHDDAERAQLPRLLARTGERDVVILDRGYPSFDVFVMLARAKRDFVVRLQASSFKVVEHFVAAGAEEGHVVIEPPQSATEQDAEALRLRVVVVRRPGHDVVVLLTTLGPEEFSADEIRAVYRLRWEVEEYYKLVQAPFFGQGQFHARTRRGVEQEIFAQALFVAVTRHLMASASKTHDKPYAEISQKAAVLALGKRLTQLALQRDPQIAAGAMHLLIERIADARQPCRPGRRHPRRSFLPERLWSPIGKRRKSREQRRTERKARLA
jgi:hypothetical protein